MAKPPKRDQAGALVSSASALSLSTIVGTSQSDIAVLVAALPSLDLAALSLCWRNHLGGAAPTHLQRWLLVRVLAFRFQAAVYGDLDKSTLLKLKRASDGADCDHAVSPFSARVPATRKGAELRPGAMLAREWRGKLERVTALEEGFAWNGKTYGSLSQVAKAITGTNWNGHRFFGLRSATPINEGAATPKSKGRRPPRSEPKQRRPLASKPDRRRAVRVDVPSQEPSQQEPPR